MSDTLGQSENINAMYLKEVTIRGFRSCANVTIPLSPGITLLVGENNSGKSNVIEALRLSTAPLNGRRVRYFEVDDVTRGHVGPVLITNRFADLTPFQRAHFIGALDLNTEEAVHCTKYRPPVDSISRGHVDHLVGTVASPDPEPEKREQINHVYLMPLRDAQSELGSYSGTRLARIIQHLATPEEQLEFVQSAESSMKELARHPVVRMVQSAIQQHLTELTSPGREQIMDAAYDPPELVRLARNLRLKMAEAGLSVADISESGLGYANLLFMATVILELQKSRESELTLFLVEEPEAHLHPQLQKVLLQFLIDQAAESVNCDASEPAGRIQVVATTHSPNLANSVGIDDIVVLRRQRDITGTNSSASTSVIPLGNIPLAADEKRKINQYLDASRSELLFARRAVLVEGIAEAVILPVLAKKCMYGGTSEQNITARRSFAGVSLINVGSVDFKPYLKLLLTLIDGQRLVDRLCVITDADPPLPIVAGSNLENSDDFQKSSTSTNTGFDALLFAPAGCETPDGVAQAGSNPNRNIDPSGDIEGKIDDHPKDLGKDSQYNRAVDLRLLIENLNATEVAHVAEAPHTLEADLLEPGEPNLSLLGKAFLRQKRQSQNIWTAIRAAPVPAQAFYEKLRGNKKFISKGEFAHDVADLITGGEPFESPEYLKQAIDFITRNPVHD